MEEIEFLTVKEFGKKMRVNRDKVYEWIETGRIRAIKTGNSRRSHWRIPNTEILRLHSQAYDIDFKEDN